MRTLIVLIVLLALGAGAAWYVSGRAAVPVIEIAEPTKVIGQSGTLAVNVDTPDGKLVRLDIAIEQGGKRTTVFSLEGGADIAKLAREGDDRLRVTGKIGKAEIPAIEAGPLRILVTAVRPVLFGYRQLESSAQRDIQVRLAPPQVSVQSAFHYINLGGSEMVVYRVNPADAISGVRVGPYEYPGFPASGAGVAGADPSLRVAFFAVLWDQDVKTPISVYARDEVGNEGVASFDYRIFPKTFRKSRIELDDRFLAKVVPAILQNTPELKVDNPADLLGSYIRINRELRRMNNATIMELARHTSPRMLWQGVFKQLGNTAVEAGFADQRTYVYKGEDVDHQVHLGFDLASTSNASVEAANDGKVLHAGWLGIYGNCVILDHGMGLLSLYAHLSSIEVATGASVKKNDRLGRSGTTGLAGGDHLHFTMLLGGNAITPVDWWSEKWVQDRVMRKLRDADAPAAQGAAAAQ